MLLEMDLQGADWFVTAFYANEPRMIDVFKSGKSPHPVTGKLMFGMPEELITRESKLVGLNNDPIAIEEIRKQLPELSQYQNLPRSMSIRQASKKSNHGGNYREAYKTFSLVNEIQETEGKRWLELYHKAYPGLRERWYPWIDKTISDTRILTNCFGRSVYFQGALNDETFRQATAFVPQSTVFDVTGHAMPRIFEDDSPDFAPAELLAQVHDSLLMQYTSRDFRAMARYAVKVGLGYMSPTLRYNDMEFTLGVGLKVGRSWGSMEEIKLTPDPDALAIELERVYDKVYS